MPQAIPVLVAGAGLYSASKDRKVNQQNVQQSAQERAENQALIRAGEQQAQGYLSGALPQMQDYTQQGYSNAYDMLSGAIPQQIGAIQQGGADAQRFLMGSMPYYQQALMGTPINYEQVIQNTKPINTTYDASMFSQKLPQFNFNR